jgi:glyoxylase-like metal-dependent hydrolase (beta-lactamase superfamily II)
MIKARGKMQKITNNVYAGVTFRGCNSSFVVTTEGVVMIDTPMVPAKAKKWREEAERYGEIRYIIIGQEKLPSNGDHRLPQRVRSHT